MTDRSALLRNAARWASANPFFLAGALAAVMEAEALDEAALAARLGCPSENVVPMLLCRRPRGAPADFRSDVQQIAQRYGANPQSLAELVREADTLRAFSGVAEERQSYLAAARDREPVEAPIDPESDRAEGGDAPP